MPNKQTEPPQTVLISGGTGLIGRRLTDILLKEGRRVHHLSRSPDKHTSGGVQTFGWDPAAGEMDPAALAGVEAIVHLAGAGIADAKWTDQRKKIIIDSRVNTANLLYDAVIKSGTKLNSFVSASGINYYGARTDAHIYAETDPPSSDFIGEVCKQWEAAASRFEDQCRVVMLRTSMVLASEGGALPRISAPVKWGVGAALGSGKQYVPYIHIDDLCRIYLKALDDPGMKGAYNACNGEHLTNKALTKSIAEEWNRPLWLPNVPAFALRAVLGEMAQLVLEGSRASADKILGTGFRFVYPDIRSALGDLH